MKLPEFKFIKLETRFQAEESATLPPFLGSTIRGILNVSMRNLVCIAPKVQCHLCKFAPSCSYPNFFNSAGNIAGSVNPYILYAPIRDKVSWKKGDMASFDLTTFGLATEKIDYYIQGIANMEKYGWGVNRKKFSPLQIINKKDKTLIWSKGKLLNKTIKPTILPTQTRETNSVLIHFNSPTRIVVRRKLQTSLTFSNIIQSIMTRVRLLSHAYTGKVLNWDETDLLEKAEKIKVVEESWKYINFERYTRFRDGKLGLPAIEGYARFEGDLTPFVPLLEMGKVVQIGKNTSHGFGHYDLYYV